MIRYRVIKDRTDVMVAGPFDTKEAALLCRDALEREAGDDYSVTP